MENQPISAEDGFIGTILLQRYIITKKFNDEGAYGTIFQANTQDGGVYLVKISEDSEMNKLEHQILCALQTIDQKLFPKVYGGGSFILENGTAFSFIILEKLGRTLASYLDARNKPFSLKTVC